jgi:methyl-accepting chemotaxis protein
MLIKQKLIVNTTILFIAMAMMLGLINYANSSLQHDIAIAKNIGDIKVSVLELRRNEKDFLSRKDMKYSKQFQQHLNMAQTQINSLAVNFLNIGINLPELVIMRDILEDYQTSFSEVVRLQKAIGLNPQGGLYGKLRAAVHAVETLLGENEYQLRSEMLQVRRNEKDFMLRLDDKYVDRFVKNAVKLANSIKISSFSSAKKQQLINLLQTYEEAFNELVSTQKSLGYKATMGELNIM